MQFIFHLHIWKNNPYNFALESGSHLTNPHIAPLTSTFHVFPQRFSLSFQMLAWRRRLSQSSSLGRREGRPEAVGVTNKIIASSEGLVMPRAKRFLRNKKLRKLFKDLKTSWTETYLKRRFELRTTTSHLDPVFRAQKPPCSSPHSPLGSSTRAGGSCTATQN